MPGCSSNTREKKKEPGAERQGSSARRSDTVRPIGTVRKSMNKRLGFLLLGNFSDNSISYSKEVQESSPAGGYGGVPHLFKNPPRVGDNRGLIRLNQRLHQRH
jgi:hypothetical protein